jgi:hypothetical protein
MRTMWTIPACLAVLFGVASPTHAHTADVPLPALIRSRALPVDLFAFPPEVSDRQAAQRAAELQQWVVDYTEWLTWSNEWRNRRQPGWFTSYRERPDMPEPPAWLAERCESAVDDAAPLMQACMLLEQTTAEYALVQVLPDAATAPVATEDTNKTIWWEHVHIDALWPAMQLQGSVFGVIGVHTTTTVKGRLQVFLAPGAMLLNLPARDGTRTWKFAANYGIGFRLIEFGFPGSRRAVLHLNLARAWLLSDVKDVVSGRTTDFAGFSMTFQKSR